MAKLGTLTITIFDDKDQQTMIEYAVEETRAARAKLIRALEDNLAIQRRIDAAEAGA